MCFEKMIIYDLSLTTAERAEIYLGEVYQAYDYDVSTTQMVTDEPTLKATERILRKAADFADGEAEDYENKGEEYLDADDGMFFIL